MKTKDLLFLRTLQGWFILLFVLMSGFFLQGFAQSIVVTNPASPWTVPANVTSIKVEVWGGGGAGGGANWFNGGYGSGGGGGAYNVATFTVSPLQTYTITIGAGGTGGSDANGNPGTASSVTGTGGTVTSNPGTGGARRGGTAGTGGTGGFNNGGNGGTGTSNGAGGGGGAGNASPTGAGNGGAGTNTTAGSAGLGSPNVAPYIGGIGALAISSDGTGNTGATPGGGGGGGRATGFNSKAGGAGGAGQVVITYTPCIPPSAPTVTSPVDYCINSTANQLTATGSNLLWYTAATGGTGSSTAPTPVTTAAGTTSYYVSQTVGCEGPRAQIDVVVHALPSASVTGKTDITCNGASNGTITVSASGGTTPYQFSIDNGSTYTAGSSPYKFSELSAGVQYKIRVKDSFGCMSPIIP